MIGPNDVPSLAQMGIRVVLSAVPTSEATADALASAGIEQVYVRMTSAFDHADRILETVGRYPAQQVFLHCRHGADRTGAMAAFLLVVRHSWHISDALYSVLYRSDDDVTGLVDVFESVGIQDERSPDDPTVGFYSLHAVGQVGGLKARNDRYARLVLSTIEAMRAYSPRL
jgi:hypothetical protein